MVEVTIDICWSDIRTQTSDLCSVTNFICVYMGLYTNNIYFKYEMNVCNYSALRYLYLVIMLLYYLILPESQQ